MSENYLYGTLPARTNPIRILEVKILNTLNGGGTGGGGTGFGSVSQGDGAPVANPLNTSASALYTDRLTGTLYFWNITNQAWE